MPIFARLRILFIAACCFLPLAHLHGAPVLPQADNRLSTEATGEPLETLLPRLGKKLEIRLNPARELAAQRITLVLTEVPVDLLARGLQELLSADAEAIVFWTRAGDRSWILEESQNRRRLAERLRNQDLEVYRKHLESEVAWLRREGSQRLAEASAAPDPRKRAIVLERVALAGLMDMLGDAGRARLLAGSPYALQVGQLPPALRSQYREYLINRSARLSGTPPDELDKYSLVLLLARTPTDPNGVQFVESLVRTDGFCWARGSLLGMPAKQPLPFLGPRFALPPLREQETLDKSRRVSLTLTPAPGAKPGVVIERNLDEVLETVAHQCELNVIADGYLRPPCHFPANLRVTDYPLTKLLDALTQTWGCDWRFLDADKKTILVRARGWWLEDAADVPQPLVNEFRDRLRTDRSPALADVLRLAELSKAQIHKLIECRICPAATGLVKPGWYDEAGVRPCLQFFNRLPGPLQARAQSPEGLSLREVPQELVDTWLLTTLMAEAGAVKPEFQKELVFSLRPGARDPTAPAGFAVAIRRSQPGRTLWIGYIQPPSRPADTPKAVPTTQE